MVLSGGLPVLSLLPKVTILPVFHLLTIVEDNRAILRPGRRAGRLEFVNTAQDSCYFSNWRTFSPCLWGTGQPLIMFLKGDQVGCDLLEERKHLGHPLGQWLRVSAEVWQVFGPSKVSQSS